MSRESELEEGRTVHVVVDAAAPPATETIRTSDNKDDDPVEEEDDQEAHRKKWFKEVHAWVTVLATIAASVTFQAGLNPPGRFWQADDNQGHRAGDPVLRDQQWSRYLIFIYLNATAFVTSLLIMVLLLSLQYRYTKPKVAVLMLTAFVDLVSLIGAYIAGCSTRYYFSFIYVIVIAAVAVFIIVLFGEVNLWAYFAFIVANLQLRCFPVPVGVVRRMEERRQRGACSPCCAPRAND